MEIKVLAFWFLSLFSFALLLAVRYIVGFWNDLMWLPLVSSLVFLFLAIFYTKSDFKKLLLSRTSLGGMNFLTASLVCLGFLLGFGFLSVKYNVVWDLSEDRRFSLSDASQKILDQLDSKYEIMVFYTQEDKKRKEATFQTFNKMQAYTDKIRVEFYDPNLYPEMVEEYNIRASGTIIIEGNDKQTRVIDSTNPKVAKESSALKEENIINAILQLSRDKDVLICYSNGHGEKSLSDTSVLGASDFYSALKDLAYDFLYLDLKQEESISQDCDILMILGPEFAYEEKALNSIYDYIKGGGKAFIAMDPGKRHNLGRVSKFLGLTFTNLFVVDMEGQVAGSNAALTVGRNYNSDNLITKNLNDELYSFFPVASFFEEEANEDFHLQPLIYSSKQSFSQQDLTRNPSMNTSVDKTGPFPIAYFIKGLKFKEAEVFMVADSDFVLNQFFLKVSNSDIALNAISYLSGEKDLISIDRSAKSKDVLMLSNLNKNIYVVVFLSIPILFFMLALFLYIKGKNEQES
mgnify:CR=1 FL=1|tara:strand:- start:1042 stop:2595 length:1554 start_codon:yes stop_codon:yes gene_type:complete